MINNTIICVKWGQKYSREYVEKLKKQCEDNCSIPFNFYCLTDNPQKDYDILLPTYWDSYYHNFARGFFWAYRKCYMFGFVDDCLIEEDGEPFLLEDGGKILRHTTTKKDKISAKKVPGGPAYNRKEHPVAELDKIEGNQFLFLDLDVIVHQDLKYFFDLPMDKPWIVRGWWNDIDHVKYNYPRYRSTALNSSVIRWNRGQLKKVYTHIDKNAEAVFFTYPSMDNYLNHHWYDCWDEDNGFFRGFPKGDIYSFYKGNTFPDDMELRKMRDNQKICLFNNSTYTEGEYVEDIKEQW
jgi:hypothetical protein